MDAIVQDLNIEGLMALDRELQVKKGNEFGYAGIWLFTGAQGSGKTLLLMHTLRQMMMEFPDAIVVSNISIYGVPSYVYKGIEDFEKYNNGAKGDKNVDVKAAGKISLFISGIALSDVGARVYATDDNTFTLSDTGNSYVGKLVRFERSDYGIVAFDFLTSEETAATQTTTTESQE